MSGASSTLWVMKKYIESAKTVSPQSVSPSITGSLRDSQLGAGHVGDTAGPRATDVAEEILFTHRGVVDALNSIIRHPRSLARPTAHWRPPIKELPGIMGAGHLQMALTRHRVGPLAKARVRGYGELREPVYLISARVTDPRGERVPGPVAEGWIRSLVDNHLVGAIHEILTGSAATFVWMVDREFRPVHSPVSLFTGFSEAA